MSERNGTSIALLVGVYATFALDVFSTLNSSPQTTELFSRDREETLMHWVAIGSGVAVAGGVVATMLDGRLWPLLATIGVAGGMYGLYRHAVTRGQDQAAPAGASGY